MKGRLVRGDKAKAVSKVIENSQNMAAGPSDNEDDEVVEIAISKNFFDFENIGPIDSDVPVIDEVQSFVDVVMDCIMNGRKQAFNELFGQILQVFASVAYEAVYTIGEMKAAEHALVMFTTYQDLLRNLHLKDGYAEAFFRKWPGGVLPEEFYAWADNKFANGKNGKEESLNEWINKEAPKHASASKETKLQLYFGNMLINSAQEAFRVIKKYHNRYYVRPEELASGKNMTAMFKAMKRQLCKVYAQLQGYNTLTHRKEWKENSWNHAEKAHQLAEYRKKKIDGWERFGDRFYMPDCWLTFLLCSYPVQFLCPGKNLALASLVPPSTEVQKEMKIESKKVRRLERAAAANIKGTASANRNNISTKIPSAEVEETPSVKTFHMVHSVAEPTVTEPIAKLMKLLKEEMEELKSNIALMESYGIVSAEINSLKDRVLKIIMELAKLKQQQTEAYREETNIGQVVAASKRKIGQIASPAADITQDTGNLDDFTLPMTSAKSIGTPSPAISLRHNAGSNSGGSWAEQAKKRITEQLLFAQQSEKNTSVLYNVDDEEDDNSEFEFEEE
jgi:RNase P subunit RPR2